MRTGEKRIHYFRIIGQLRTYRKKENVSKGGEKSLWYLSSCHFPTVSVRYDILVRSLRKRYPTVARAHSLQKVSVLLKHSMHMRWSQPKIVQSNMTAPFISKQKMQTHFAMWRISCQSRSIDSTYKYKDITITKTIRMRRDKTVNSVKRLLTHCWKWAKLWANNRSSKIKISSYWCDAKAITLRARKR